MCIWDQIKMIYYYYYYNNNNNKTFNNFRNGKANKSSNSPAIALRFLQDSQDAWLKYQDLQMHLYWPSVLDKDGREPANDYGSVHPMCWSMTASDLVNNRVRDLRRMLDIEEGDVGGPAWPRVLGVEEQKTK